MGVEGGVAPAVADHHVVAVGAAVGGGDDDPRLGGQHIAGVVHPADIHPFVVGGGAGDAGVPVAVGGGDPAAGGHRPDIPAGGGVPAHLRRQLVGLLHDLLLDGLLLLLDGRQLLGIFLHVALQLRHQGVGFLPLGIQVRLSGLQGLLGGLSLGLELLLVGLLGLDLLPDLPEAVQNALVVVHDLLDVRQAAEEVGEVLGVEEDRPVGGGTVLLHGPGTAAEEVVALLLLLPVLLQLQGRLGQECLIPRDLVLGVDDLLLRHRDLLVQQHPPLDHIGLLIAQLGELCLDLPLLIRQVVGVVLQGVDVALGHRLRRPHQGRRVAAHQGKQHRQHQRQTADPLPNRFLAHVSLLFRIRCTPQSPSRSPHRHHTWRNLRMAERLPPTPISMPTPRKIAATYPHMSPKGTIRMRRMVSLASTDRVTIS